MFWVCEDPPPYIYRSEILFSNLNATWSKNQGAQKNAKTSLPGTLRLQSRIPAVLFASSIDRPKWSAEFVTLFLNRWRTGKRPSLTVHPWFLKICGWPQKFVNETGSSSILTIWLINATKFVNGSSIAADDRKTASMTQKVRQWPKSSSILTNTSCTLTNYWRTSSSILTNFLGCWRTFVVVTTYWRTIEEPLTNHWRTIDELGRVDEPDRQYWRTACFIDETSVVTCMFWGTMGELGRFDDQFVNEASVTNPALSRRPCMIYSLMKWVVLQMVDHL